MNQLHISEAIGDAWGHFTRRGWYLFGVTAAVVLLAALAVGDAVATALYSIILTGYITFLLKHARQEEIVFDDVFTVDSRWIYFAFGTLIKGALIFVGLLLFVVPGIYLVVRWMFSELYIIDKGMRPLEALKASGALTAGYRWKLFWYLLLATLISILGLLALGVGVFVSVAVVNLANIMLFWRLQALQYEKAQAGE